MRIGLFTDTFRPSVNGIVYVVESLKKHLEQQGHEVYIFCPGGSIRPSGDDIELAEQERVIRFPSIKGRFHEDYDTTLFFPPRVLSRIKELDLDVIHFFTPGQIGLMGVYAAYKTDTPLIAQHCTDLREYVEHYRDPMLLPGLLVLIALLPLTIKFNGKDVVELMRLYRPRRERVEWNINIVERMVTLIYSKCDGVIALSRKSKQQLESWQHTDNYKYPVTLMPNGVDKLAEPTKTESSQFRKKYGIKPSDQVVGFVGRLGSEKNLDLLIDSFDIISQRNKRAKLIFVGDFSYKRVLKRKAKSLEHADRVIFTGTLPRESLGVVYDQMEVFVFPSMTDTQGWAIHEAAMAGLPIVLIDRKVSEVVKDGVNGFYADNSAESLAENIEKILDDDNCCEEFSAASIALANKFTEEHQVKKLVRLYKRVIKNSAHKQSARSWFRLSSSE